MVVEFLGIAGSGKTTLCSAIASQLRRDGFAVITRDDYFAWMQQPWHRKLSAVVTNGLQTWRLVLRVYSFLYFSARLRGRTLIKTGYHLTYMHVWLTRTVSSASPFFILLDQFAWHRLANQLMHRPLTDRVGARLIDTMKLFYPRCDVHWILKTAPVELAVQRICKRHVRESRAPWYIEKLPPDRQQVLLSRQVHLYELVCDAIQSRYRGSLYCVDGAGPIAEQVHHIKGIIAKSLKRVTSGASISTQVYVTEGM